MKLSLLVKACLSATILFTGVINSVYSQQVALLFAGDAMQHKKQLDNAFRGGIYDYSSYFKYIKDEISEADLAVVNLETTLGGGPFTGYPRFCSPDAYAEALKDAGFDVFLLANNHILDRYSTGLVRTVNVLDSLNVAHTGAFKDESDYLANNPLIIEKAGFRLAFLNYTYGANGNKISPPCILNLIDREQITTDIQKSLNHAPDAMIAIVHWGIEYKLVPTEAQRELARFLAESGVDIIIGSHPHVVQPSEIITDSAGKKHAVVYSLGNFVSAMAVENSVGGQLAKITLERTESGAEIKSCQYTLLYVDQRRVGNKIDFSIIPVSLAKKKEYEEFSDSLINLSAVSYNKMIKFYDNAKKLFNEQNYGFTEYFF